MVITNRKQPLPAAEFMDKWRDTLFSLSGIKNPNFVSQFACGMSFIYSCKVISLNCSVETFSWDKNCDVCRLSSLFWVCFWMRNMTPAISQIFYYVIILYLLLDLPTFLVSSQSRQSSYSNLYPPASVAALGCRSSLEFECKPHECLKRIRLAHIPQNIPAVYTGMPMQSRVVFLNMSLARSHGMAASDSHAVIQVMLLFLAEYIVARWRGMGWSTVPGICCQLVFQSQSHRIGALRNRTATRLL